MKEFSKIFFNSEWAICAIILFGQSIVKFSSGIANSEKKFKWQIISFLNTLIIIIGLIPSIIVLVIIILTDSTSLTLHIFQIFLFILSCISFFIVGAAGQELLERKK